MAYTQLEEAEAEEDTPSEPPVERPFRWAAKCESQVFSVAYSPDNAEIATGDGASTLTMWSRATGEKLRTLECERG
eukprot:5753192-Prymnesium_polylepis.1